MINTPYSIAVGQILVTRMQVVAESPQSRSAGLTYDRLSSMGPPELLPHLLGTTDEVWVMAARDILVRARIRSKAIAKKIDASDFNGNAREAIEGPDIVRAALEIWGEPRPFSEKQAHIAGVRPFLESALAAALKFPGDGVRSAAAEEPRWFSVPPSAEAPAAPAASGRIPFAPEGGLPILRRLIAEKPARKEDFDAYARAFIGRQPYPIAMARMMGGDKLGQFVMVNASFLDRYKWRGPRREKHLSGMSLMDWYHPEDRNLFATLSFLLTKVLLGKVAEVPPRPVRGLSGDFLDELDRHRGARPKEEHYIRYQGAGVMAGMIAFGLFTEMPDQ